MAVVVVEDGVVTTFITQDLSLEVIQVSTCGENQSTLLTPVFWPVFEDEESMDFEDCIDDVE